MWVFVGEASGFRTRFSRKLTARIANNPTHEIKVIIWFLEELTDSMRAIQADCQILKKMTATNADDQQQILVAVF